jgi:hypothetical protein
LAAVQTAAFEFCSPFSYAAFGIATKVLGRLNVTQAGRQAVFVVVFVLGCQIMWWQLVV